MLTEGGLSGGLGFRVACLLAYVQVLFRVGAPAGPRRRAGWKPPSMWR